MPEKYREATQLGASAPRHRYVAALAAKAKTQRHAAQTGPGRGMPWELRSGYAEGSRTHYLDGSVTRCVNWQGLLAIKKQGGPAAGLSYYRHTRPVRKTQLLL
jgi:hypothetical protein